MDSISQLVHAAPAEQPDSVRQIAERLFPAYTIDGGKAQLAGCTLDDRLFIRIDFRYGEKSAVIYVDSEFQQVDAQTVEALGMTSFAELEKPPQPFEAAMDRFIGAAGEAARSHFSPGCRPEIVAVTALWCKFVEGKLRFTVGEHSAELSFSDWARTLAPPPFVCPHTACRTFHLAATDDGRIAAAEQIETCQETDRRVLRSDLATCAATGRRVLAELLEKCPVTGRRVLPRTMIECHTCHERVGAGTIRGGRCAACRQLRSVSKADPRMARLLDEHPLLDRWRRWRIAETATRYVLSATGWFRRLLVVIDKDSLELKHLSVGGRLWGAPRAVEPSNYEDVLRH